MHILMRFALEKQRENNISLALVVEKDKRWRRARKEKTTNEKEDVRAFRI